MRRSGTISCGSMVGLFFLLIFAIGFPVLYPAIGIPIYAGVLVVVVYLVRRGRARRRQLQPADEK